MTNRKSMFIGYALGVASVAALLALDPFRTAQAQLPPTYISGSGAITPGHCASWKSGTVIQDSGTLC